MPEILFGDDGTLYYANSFLEQIQKISVTLCFHLCVRHKAQGRTVDAVAHAIGGLRIAGEHMTKVRISGTASDLCTAHAVAQVLQFHHGRVLDGLCESRPAAAALLRNTVLLRRQLVPDGFRRGLLIVARVDAQQALF